MPRPAPIDIRDEIFALAREGMRQGDIAAWVGVARKTVNRILLGQAATASLEPGQSTAALRKTAVRQGRALFRIVREDGF